MVELKSDYPVTDEACKAATGKTIAEWSEVIGNHPEVANRRREALYFLTGEMGRTTVGYWWAVTVWVEHERRIGRTQKDGRFEGYNICSTKSVDAPVERVQQALLGEVPGPVRVREGKSIRCEWKTEGVDTPSEVEVLLATNGGKTGITLNHKRIQSREEADGLRIYWSARLAELKKSLEG